MDNAKFELFASLLEQEKVYMDPGLSFETLCRWIKVRPRSLDKYLMKTFGYSGNDILKAYRRAVPSYFREKYGMEI